MLLIPNKILELKQMQNVSAKTLRLTSYIIGICLRNGECRDTNPMFTAKFDVQFNAIRDVLKTLLEEGFITVDYDKKSNRTIRVTTKCRNMINKEMEGLKGINPLWFEQSPMVPAIPSTPVSNNTPPMVSTIGYGLNNTPQTLVNSQTSSNLEGEKVEEKIREISKNTSEEKENSPTTPLESNINTNNKINNINNTTAHVRTREAFVTMGKSYRISLDEFSVPGFTVELKRQFLSLRDGQDYPSMSALQSDAKEWKQKFTQEARRLKEEAFVKPSPEEISEYFIELTQKSELGPAFAKAFIAHYDAKEWKYGKVKMVDFKATIRNWNLDRFIKQHEYGKSTQNTGSGARGKSTPIVDLSSAIAARIADGRETERRIDDTTFEVVG